ncbi:hypothetical protein ACSFB8_03465 [Enterococcus faecalis]
MIGVFVNGKFDPEQTRYAQGLIQRRDIENLRGLGSRFLEQWANNNGKAILNELFGERQVNLELADAGGYATGGASAAAIPAINAGGLALAGHGAGVLKSAWESLSDGYSGKKSHMFGENGTQTTSKTTWKNGKTERIDDENPSPGKRPEEIHYHEPNNKKWRFDIDSGIFVDPKTKIPAPPKIKKKLKDKNILTGIRKGLDVLGE